MKKSTLLFILVLCIFSINLARAQQVLFKSQPRDSVTRGNPRMARYDHVTGEIIVKFKDNVQVKSTGAKLKSASAVTDALQAKYKVQKAEPLFPGESRLKSAQMLTAPNGQKFLRPSLHNIYKLKIADEQQLMNAISDFKADTANVVYAEPNYIVSICDDKPVGPVLTQADVQKMQAAKASLKAGAGPIVNDPMYDQQWYIPEIKADLVWPQTMGDTTQVIAILDTGVDWLHPDLKNKIWKNPNPSKNSYPDGIVNDIRGWDFINNDNDPMDDNSHGTHVAGIAAAETNNGIGIAGVCPNAKIMPIKVFQSSGRGDASTIAKGIKYAATHGATVINMSFGSYAQSQAMEDALANAYATCILVAAAGNDGLCIGPGPGCAPFFPAAFSFVLGVQSPEASFSNYDQDGPTFSYYDDLLNYEMKAPGTNILSTIPNGGYRVYQGTSMAAPIISGAVALYKKLIPDETQEFMWVKLIQATGQHLDLQKALTIKPKPEIWFLNKVMVDTIGIDDRDGRVDAGETIQLWFKARNTGGQVDSVYWKIRLAEFEDKSTCDIVKPTSFISSISPYASRTSEADPMKFTINKNVAHDRDITFDLLSWYKGSVDTVKQKFVFTVENGEQLSGVMDSIKILYPNRLYLVNNSYKVGTNGTLIIKPGTHILFYPGMSIPINGRLIAEGKPDSLIYFTGYSPPGNMGIPNNIFTFRNNIWDPVTMKRKFSNRFSYCKFENMSSPLYVDNGYPASAFNCIFNCNSIGTVDSLVNNYYYNNMNNYMGAQAFSPYYSSSGFVSKNNFIGPSTTSNYYGGYISTLYYNNSMYSTNKFNYNNCVNFSMPNNSYSTVSDNKQQNAWISEYSKPQQQWNGTFYQNVIQILTKYATQGTSDFQKIQYQYWGTSDSAKIEGFIHDFMEDAKTPRATFKPFLNAPPDSCHGIVWKVLVNGKDAQDQKVDPVGVGKQKFEVYFNHPMNKTIAPQVAYGVRYPFSSNAISEDGSWSEDGKIYTVYSTVKLFSGDGINRIRVSGARDLEGWEIPLEDMRFNFQISAAESSSLEFQATAGPGKVNLEWNNSGLKDLMGFNMYRMENLNDTTLTKPALVNKTLIADTLFTDFTCTPNKKYYYFYKVVRTDFSESDSSKVVTATPFTASRGDANGDLTVSVLDITSIVSYLLGQNPTPFIFDAADVNADKAVNVLDVVGVANIIKGGKSAPADDGNKYNPSIAYITLKPDIIQLKSDAQVQAVQFELQGVDLEKVKLSAAINGFELAYSVDSNKIKGVLYNLNGLTIPAGISDLIKIEESAGKLTWGNVFGADPQGKYVTILKKEDGSLTTPTSPFGLSVQPNPSGNDMQISFRLPETASVMVKVYNVMGELVYQLMDNTLAAGNHQVIWNGTNANRETVKPGIYFIKVEARDEKNQILKEQMKVVRL
ncbi:MAG: S8 family serine peptidase [Bacteroidota bacterium]|nr:S8 family serine peptidase [Bacteroidota bacterium]